MSILYHTHAGKANGHQCAHVGTALQQVDGNDGCWQVGVMINVDFKIGWVKTSRKILAEGRVSAYFCEYLSNIKE